MRSFDVKQEHEANCFGWTLLLPRPALMRCAEMNFTVSQVAEAYEVSEQLVTFRRRLIGVDRQARVPKRAR